MRDIESRHPLPRFSNLGSGALLMEAPAPLDISWQRRIWALAYQMESCPGVLETMPGMNNLMVVFDPLLIPADALQSRLSGSWHDCGRDGPAGKQVEVPVVYGGENGMDLQQVAQHAGLSVDEVVRLHVETSYTVYFLGGYPGFGYLGGLPPELAMPRRQVPRMQVPKGSVAIGGQQTGVIPSAQPSGWHIIGNANIDLFNETRDPPALLAPGDTVRFRCERIER
jgi:KipI family sensor histidine kinase inhibitor